MTGPLDIPDDAPWFALEADESDGSVAQLRAEVAPGHSLSGAVGRLVAVAVRDDDVLFQDRDDADRFYVVHLTYAATPQTPPYPWISPLRAKDLDRDFFMTFRG